MKNKKGEAYVLIAVVVIFLLIIGGIFLVTNLEARDSNVEEESQVSGTESQDSSASEKGSEREQEMEEEVIFNCKIDQDCEDSSDCTIDSCTGGVCLSTDVVLCYNGDGCCPQSCNSANDNDCLNIN